MSTILCRYVALMELYISARNGLIREHLIYVLVLCEGKLGLCRLKCKILVTLKEWHFSARLHA